MIEPENRSPQGIAKSIVSKSKSPFVDDETVEGWIASAICEAVVKAKREEERRIEKFLGTRSWNEMKKVWEMAKFKAHGLNEKSK